MKTQPFAIDIQFVKCENVLEQILLGLSHGSLYNYSPYKAYICLFVNRL